MATEVATDKEFDPLIQARASAFKPVKITPEQAELWLTVRAKFLWEAPYFSDIFYRLMNPQGTEHVVSWTDEVPIAATDGVNILINPATFFDKKYTLDNRVFIIAHEVLHAVFNHPGLMHMWLKRREVVYESGVKLPFSPDLMNTAMDHVVNAILIESKLGAFKLGEWIHDTNIATAKDSIIDTYAKLFKQCRKGGGGGGGGGRGGQSFDKLLQPGAKDGKDPDEAAGERSEYEWGAAIEAGLHAARVQGKLPLGLERALGEVLEPVVDWTDKIQSFFARKIGADSYDWRRPDRRLILRDIYAPAQSGHGCGSIVVAIDTSGSIGQKTLDRFLAEVSGILEDVKPRQLHLLWCDAQVHRADELEEPSDMTEVRSKQAPGGGGTSFVPVFNWIDEHQVQPDALVYLTDLYGDFPGEAPQYPVLWGAITKNHPVPFGEIVEVPIQE